METATSTRKAAAKKSAAKGTTKAAPKKAKALPLTEDGLAYAVKGQHPANLPDGASCLCPSHLSVVIDLKELRQEFKGNRPALALIKAEQKVRDSLLDVAPAESLPEASAAFDAVEPGAFDGAAAEAPKPNPFLCPDLGPNVQTIDAEGRLRRLKEFGTAELWQVLELDGVQKSVREAAERRLKKLAAEAAKDAPAADATDATDAASSSPAPAPAAAKAREPKAITLPAYVEASVFFDGKMDRSKTPGLVLQHLGVKGGERLVYHIDLDGRVTVTKKASA